MPRVSDLRDPELDPDYMLEPAELIELELQAEPARDRWQGLPPEQQRTVTAWLLAELRVAHRRALAVHDHDFIECLRVIERRLIEPGAFLRDARAALKIKSVLDARAQLRVLRGGGSAA